MGQSKKAFVRKNWPLMSAGKANGINYSPEVIKQAFDATVWDRKTTSIFLDHRPYEASTWIGEVKNLHLDGDDLRGDVYIYDVNTINKLEAGAKFGISPELEGREENGEMKEMKFLNFSVVFEPAVKTTYLNKDSGGIRTNYINQKFFLSAESEKEILIEQVVDPAMARFCFVDSDGNLCRWYPQDGRILNMQDEEKKDGNDVKEEAKTEETKEESKEEPKQESTQELSEIKEMLKRVLEENKEIKEELAKKKKEKYPEEKKEDYPAPEELKKKKKEKYPEYPKMEEENRQKLGEELSEDIIEALREVNSEYTDFVKEYIKEHKGEGSIAELMKKAAKEWKSRQKEKEQEETKKSLQENRQTVPQAGETQKLTEVQFEELDAELAKFLLEQQATLSER